jgi:hypothetical protein
VNVKEGEGRRGGKAFGKRAGGISQGDSDSHGRPHMEKDTYL